MPSTLRTGYCALAVAAFLWGGATPAQAQLEWDNYWTESLQKQYLESVVRISMFHKNGSGSQGSGVCIGTDGKFGYILTCGHLLNYSNSPHFTKIESFSARTYPNPLATHQHGGTQHCVHRPWDLRLIKVPGWWTPRLTPVCRASTRLMPNLPVLSIGCGNGAPPGCQLGKLTGQYYNGDPIFNRGAVGGRSGGPLISAHGTIGVLTAGWANSTSAAAHPQKIHQFLRATGHGWLIPPG